MKQVLLLLIVVAICFVGAAAVRAETISRNNPFRGYNLGGINYGSQQWEKEHRGQQQPSHPHVRRVRIRRR
jgi:hypothetical protein